jgi:benzodiazapine receptor
MDLNLTASPRRYALLAIFLMIVLGVGFAIGLTIRPGAWYQTLAKPFFTPPNWLFGPAWTVVYMLIAIAGWRVTITEGTNSPSFRLWLGQMLLNWAWTPVFFGLHQIGPGLVIIVTLLATVLAFIWKTRDQLARWCFAPYALWLCYASALNAAILILN